VGNRARDAEVAAPTSVLQEGSLIKRSLRDLYNRKSTKILVAGEAGYQEARDFNEDVMPSERAGR